MAQFSSSGFQELEISVITHQWGFDASICFVRKRVLSISDGHDGCAFLGVTWYRSVPVHPRDGDCVNVVYVTVESTAVT